MHLLACQVSFKSSEKCGKSSYGKILPPPPYRCKCAFKKKIDFQKNFRQRFAYGPPISSLHYRQKHFSLKTRVGRPDTLYSLATTKWNIKKDLFFLTFPVQMVKKLLFSKKDSTEFSTHPYPPKRMVEARHQIFQIPGGATQIFQFCRSHVTKMAKVVDFPYGDFN